MDWKQLYLSLDGRIGRASYWVGSIILSIIVFIAQMADFAFGTMQEGGYGIISGIASLAVIYPSIVVTAKRWHDRGKSGWWTLILLVPIIGAIWMLVECGFLRGTQGDNQYGPDPLRY
ncbi:MAG: DUF805 domain-containing protein [Hyphomicrobiales bacterium]|uniref:DUF805 domain-containing protein n=1 Tax=Aestuariivirga sp. TaxID=2650926 RepID=UPI0035B413C1